MNCKVNHKSGHRLQIGEIYTAECVRVQGPRELWFPGSGDFGSVSNVSEYEVRARSRSTDLRSLVPRVPGTDRTLLYQSLHTKISLFGLRPSLSLFLPPSTMSYFVSLLADNNSRLHENLPGDTNTRISDSSGYFDPSQISVMVLNLQQRPTSLN